MPTLDTDQAAKIASHPATASLVGGLFGLRFLPGASIMERMWHAGSGVAASYYVAPSFAAWLHLDQPGGMAVAFVVGAFGVSVADALSQAIRSTSWGEVLGSWVRRRE